ncbi:hypothetical protein D3H65_10690 [Paraflavitalea soli]|uniref:FAS1 domain-containing protein n=1 Tax=Paraflavitalea soli TaxID=2315862 RepID=A0A3B7MIZ1_9BACT|nr:hypothetical protein [Paraflavitalea soli]AXY74414.1 hypothetical protein D3H65_10690 [Paraflavitalea soli]
MKNIIPGIFVLLIAASLVSCKKDGYKNDGGTHDPRVNMTTYDFLKSKPQFSSLIRLIDRAGLKDAINGNITFFASTNFSVDEFVRARYYKKAKELNDENIIYTLDSLPLQEIKDSLKMYMYTGDLGRDKLTLEGKYIQNLLGTIPNTAFYIKLRRVKADDFNPYLNYVDYINFTKVIATRDETEPDPKKIPAKDKDMSVDCQTTGIITTTGIIHVLDDYHRLFFNTEELPK